MRNGVTVTCSKKQDFCDENIINLCEKKSKKERCKRAASHTELSVTTQERERQRERDRERETERETVVIFES